MPDETIQPQRQIACRRDGVTVIIDLSGDDDRQVLFLTVEEAERLVSGLKVELVCAGECPPPKIAVADVSIAATEAWQLVDAIGSVLGLKNLDDADDRLAVPWWKQ